MSVKTEAAADGIRYIATSRGKTYRSLHYHRSKGGRDKSIWSITRPEEFALFCKADDRDWHDDRGYWGFRNGTKDKLGDKNQRMALFPEKAPADDDWHGFPLRLTPVRHPAATLANAWVAAQEVTFAVGEKIKRGKL